MRTLLSALFLLLSFAASAQRAVWQKTTPLVRQAAREGQRDVQAAKSLGRPVKERVLMAFIQTAAGQQQALAEYGAKVYHRSGDIAIAALPLSRLQALAADARILRIEANRSARVQMDTTATQLGADRVQEGLALPQGYSGKGVVVGVQDIGFDLTHPTFWSRDMKRYRIKALWDQISPDTLGSTLPSGRDYRDSLALLTVAHPYDGLIQTHGTHTASTAAGSGMEGPDMLSPYSGIAYDADIALVCNATSDDIELIPEEDYYKYTFALDALGFKYLFDYADSVGKPCVINFSEGSQQDFQGYDVLYYQMLDDLVGPGHILVASAGNDGQKLTYAHKPSGQEQAEIHVNASGSLAFTTKSSSQYALTLRYYLDGLLMERTYTSQDVMQQADSLLTDSFLIRTLYYKLSAQAYPSCYDDNETVIDWTVSVEGAPFSSGPECFVTLSGKEADVEMYRVSGEFHARAHDGEAMAVDNSRTVHSPGSAPSVICVGATGYRTSFLNYLGETKVYDNGQHGQLTPFSSLGPTWDGRTKPDVVAPGQNIIAAYSSYYLEHNPTAGDISSDVRHFDYQGRTYAWNANGGTSMSAPVVTGIIALWLEAYPRLTPDDCKAIFAQTCTRYDATLSYPNSHYGYGQIDAYAGMQQVLALAATGIHTVPAEAPSASAIYTLDGRYLGTDAAQLPRGIYIVGGRKVVVSR